MTAHVVVGAAAAQGQPWLGSPRMTVVELKIDLGSRSQVPAGFVTADTIKVMAIPAGSLIQNVVTHVVTAEGASATCSVGDSGSATRFHSALDLNTVAATASGDIIQFYATADYILLTLGGTLSSAKGAAVFHVVFQLTDLGVKNSFGPL